ncbi:ly6/PLAUR domain-containing protein 1 isoform X2 [Gopherus evgoodei]|uniref:ly6/PLAUR domain-containing protein 1 isoform X2 n=1 Tax=Gopherus evgoodei TaxID=1825980 RepID=UPI0011CFD0E8|nr:ly6/PLAUR domain-containing protein 1 isoform X2 [Gopherus evgoodei]
MWLLFGAATFWGLVLAPGFGLQIQCYQCEEFQLNNDCSAPEFIVNCTVNVQDMCQKEVMEKSSAGESPWSSCCRFSHPTHSRMQQREEVLPVQAGGTRSLLSVNSCSGGGFSKRNAQDGEMKTQQSILNPKAEN